MTNQNYKIIKTPSGNFIYACSSKLPESYQIARDMTAHLRDTGKITRREHFKIVFMINSYEKSANEGRESLTPEQTKRLARVIFND